MRKTMMIGSLLLILVSCGKDKKNECEVNMANLSGNWKTSTVKYKASASSSEVDYYNVIFSDACERDDYLSLKSDGTFTQVDAGTVCIPNNTSSGNWSVTSTTLTLNASSSQIDDYSCNTLVLRYNNAIVSGDVLITTLVRQ